MQTLGNIAQIRELKNKNLFEKLILQFQFYIVFVRKIKNLNGYAEIHIFTVVQNLKFLSAKIFKVNVYLSK